MEEKSISQTRGDFYLYGPQFLTVAHLLQRARLGLFLFFTANLRLPKRRKDTENASNNGTQIVQIANQDEKVISYSKADALKCQIQNK